MTSLESLKLIKISSLALLLVGLAGVIGCNSEPKTFVEPQIINLTYPALAMIPLHTLEIGKPAIGIKPTYSGGTVLKFSIAPALDSDSGLRFNEESGEITGSPLLPLSKNFRITADLGENKKSASVVITLNIDCNSTKSYRRGACQSRAIDIKLGDDGRTCVLKADETVACWRHVQPDVINVPEALKVPNTVKAISFSFLRPCALLKKDGSVICWGEFGNPAVPADLAVTVDSAVIAALGVTLDPVVTAVPSSSLIRNIPLPENLKDVTAIAAGYSHVCALESNGSVSCWGDNSAQQCIIPPGQNENITAIAAGKHFTCAIKKNGSVSCWGDRDYGKIDPPLGLTNVTSLTAGFSHTCALKADRSITCWGQDFQLKFQAPSSPFEYTVLAAGRHHTCGLTSTGLVGCWGRTVAPTIVPLGLSDVTVIAAGDTHTCAIKRDGSVICWGLHHSPVPEDLK